MKVGKVLLSAILIFGLLNGIIANAQSSGFVKQVITVNSGRFEYTPPFADYVTVQAFNPQTGNVSPFSTIFTQSSQAVIIADKIAYVAAQDSIVKYNLNTMQRLGAVRNTGLCQLALIKDKLIVSKQYPTVNYFVEVLDTVTMDVVARISGISGDCGGITMADDTVYVAVNEGWAGTRGKLAIIDPAGWTLESELDLGTSAVGIFNLYNYNGKVISVNKTPYGVTNAGSVTVYDPADRTFNNILLPHSIGTGAGIKDSLLYMIMDYGIGSFNMNTLAVQDPAIIPDPGSSIFKYITSAVIDTLDNRIYANIGDYTTAGTCRVTSLTGDPITSYATGISSEAIAIDYRTDPTGIPDGGSPSLSLTVWPNPVLDKLNVPITGNHAKSRLFIVDGMGRVVFSYDDIDPSVNDLSIDCRNMVPGVYHIILEGSGNRSSVSFIKR